MWQQRLAALQAEPTDDHLQLVCDLLDEADAEVCRRWNEAGHVERLAELRARRADVRRVTVGQLGAQAS